MKSNSKVWAVLIVIAIIAISGNFLPKGNTIVERLAGARPGPDTDSQCTTQNGLQTCQTRRPLTLATTTPCAIKSPSATSTLVESGVIITTASSTATTWVMAKATTPFATTTYLDLFSLSSGVQGALQSSATTTGIDIKQTFAPNTWFVVSKSGDTPAGVLLAGQCSATFQVF